MPHKIIIPRIHPHHQRLSDMINSFASKHEVICVFFSYSSNAQKHCIIIHIASSQVPEEFLKSKWINKAREQYGSCIIILGSVDVNRHLRLGSLFINRHCNASTFIYKKDDHEFSYPERSKQLKKHKRLKEAYYRTHDLLSTEIGGAKNNSALNMAYHLYIRLFEHHLFHLEFLCLGRYFCNAPLNERFLRLEKHLPDIKQWMLKKTGASYFAIEALYSAKTADEEQDPMLLKNEFEEAITWIEQQLYLLVQGVFKEAKMEVMAIDTTTVSSLTDSKAISPYEAVTSILTKHSCIDEIFLYHQEEVYSAEQKTIVLYLLIISEHISNQNLLEMMHIVSQKTEKRFSIVPIAHSKVWIQEHLWEYQAFFKKIMIAQHSIYRSEGSTVIHWHAEPSKRHIDIELYVRFCIELYHNYQLLRVHEEQKKPRRFWANFKWAYLQNLQCFIIYSAWL